MIKFERLKNSLEKDKNHEHQIARGVYCPQASDELVIVHVSRSLLLVQLGGQLVVGVEVIFQVRIFQESVQKLQNRS